MNLSPILNVQIILKKRNADAIFVSNPINIYYLTGFRGLSPEEREVSLLVTQEKADLFVPKMYEAQAQKLESVKNGVVKLVVEAERDNLMISFIKYCPQNGAVLYEGNNLLVTEFQKIKEKCSQRTLIDAEGLIENLRVVKTDAEIEKIKKAVSITDETYNGLVKYLQSTDYTKLTELDITDLLRKISRDLGGEGFSFDPIVASGAGSAEPHYFTSNKKLQKGDVLLLDLGIKYQGYCGDLTRVLSLGKASEEIKKMYNIVLKNNELALASCKAGISEGELAKVSVEDFKRQNLDQYFLHSLGHGIGLAAHEDHPYLRLSGKDILQPRMSVTIEPGLYFHGTFGIRIEDYVIVTENGCEVLSTKSPKEKLIEI